MTNRLPRLLLELGAALACVTGGAAAAQGLATLGQLEPGLWELKMRDDGRSERICVPDARRLIQLRHPSASCRQIAVKDDPNSVTIHYSCAGRGTGRTRLRLESARLIQLETSGVADNLPFDVIAEARRVGACPAA